MERLVLGTMNIRYKHTSCTDDGENERILSHFLRTSPRPILDTASYYDEAALGEILTRNEMDASKAVIATKANPWYQNDFTSGILGQLSPAHLERQLNESRKRLGRVDIYYLHCPDYETPLLDTLSAADTLWRQEKFGRFGLSNFSKTQLEDVLNLCEDHGYVQPTYYQGMYNLLCRKVEEIFPILDANGIEFWAYNPLAGGLLTGKYRDDPQLQKASRFHNNSIYQNIFWKPEMVNAYDDFLKKTSPTNPTALAFHWLHRHSRLRPEDKIVLGVSTHTQLEQNMSFFSSTQQEEESITPSFFETFYEEVREVSPNYFY
jgi:aflatoxin B1 aldehyde reductase